MCYYRQRTWPRDRIGGIPDSIFVTMKCHVAVNRVVHKMSLLFFSFLFHPPIPKSGNLLKLDQGRDPGFKIQ